MGAAMSLEYERMPHARHEPASNVEHRAPNAHGRRHSHASAIVTPERSTRRS
jgi:hypothetical protein